MQKVINWFNQPYPYEGTWQDSIKGAFTGGLFVFLFLVVFQPFGLHVEKGHFWSFVLVCSYFGLITATILLLLTLTMQIAPSFFKEDGWVIWKEIITNIVVVMMIGTGNMLLASYIFGQTLSIPVFWFWQKITLSVGILPILFTAYTKQQILQKRHTKGADDLNTKITEHSKVSSNQPTALTLTGDNQNESFSISPTNIFYLESADNYVRIFYQKDGAIADMLLRSTLKKMEQQLADFPRLFRCHRTYMVNLDQVERVSGNAQGYKLHLKNGEVLIPVSRSLNAEIDKRLN